MLGGRVGPAPTGERTAVDSSISRSRTRLRSMRECSSEAAPLLTSIDALLIDDLSDDEDDAFAAALGE